MIEIIIRIEETTKDETTIHILGANKGPSTEMEKDVADEFKDTIIATKNKIEEKMGWNLSEVVPLKYMRKFNSPNDRDKHADKQ